MLLPDWTTRYLSITYEELDCWELVNRVYHDRYGLDIGDIGDQVDMIKIGDWRDVLEEKTPSIEGDILLFKSSPVNRHVALFLCDTYMLHSNKGTGVVIEKFSRPRWKDQLISCYRHKSR